MNTIERFQNWFNRHGHWMHETRAEALRVWIKNGINGLPNAPANAEQLLREWVA